MSKKWKLNWAVVVISIEDKRQLKNVVYGDSHVVLETGLYHKMLQ